MLELVAPAGDMASFRLAIAHGADAIYVGGKSFSARQYAVNLEPRELRAAIRLAHLHRVRVYATMNTLLRREEMEEALAQARDLFEAGVDAVIVQDLGFLACLRETLPDLRVHASTQMTVANAATVQALARLGVCRVVLAREAVEEEVRALATAGPELEVFVHGALCYSYSGQCLMSSIIGGRSGNRGRCAQPCRLEYALTGPGGVDLAAGAGKYLLSPRDLCLLPYLARLQDTGVRALKIEGRMKRPEYVGTVVRVYRQALDRLAVDPCAFRPERDEERDLEQVFNRGFTPGFFLGDQGLAYQSCLRPNNRGLLIGRVAAVDRSAGRATLALGERVRRGDGIEIWVTRGGRVGSILERMETGGRAVDAAEAGQQVTIPLGETVCPGDRVFRTSDAALNARAWAPLDGHPGLALPFLARIRLEPGLHARLELADDGGHAVTVHSEVPGQRARNRPLSEETIREHISRTGGSNWTPAGIEVTLVEETMLPLSELNRLRRAGLAALEEARLASWPRLPACPANAEPSCEEPGHIPAPLDASGLRGTVGSPTEARAALAAGVSRIYLASWLDSWPDHELRTLKEEARQRSALLVYALPRVAPERESSLWVAEMQRARRLDLDGVRLGDLGLAALAQPDWNGRIYLDFSLNVMNPWSLRHVLRQAACVTLSPEMTLAQARDLAAACPGRIEVIAHGRLEMMLSAHCLLGAVLGGKEEPGQACRRPCAQGEYALRDRLGLQFPLVPDRFCRLHVLNSLDLCVLPELDKLYRSGCGLRLELHGRGPRYVRAVVQAYRSGLRSLAGGTWTRAQGERDEAKLAGFSPAGFTRGHFFRGVE